MLKFSTCIILPIVRPIYRTWKAQLGPGGTTPFMPPASSSGLTHPLLYWFGRNNNNNERQWVFADQTNLIVIIRFKRYLLYCIYLLCVGVGAGSGRDMSAGDDGVGYRPITHNIQGDSDSDTETDRSSLLHSSIQSEARHLINTNDAPKDR